MKANNKKVNLTSSNLSEEKQAELRRILPEAFSDNRIDWDKLRAVLGDKIDSRVEKFSFTWAGKSDAIKNVLIPSKATLRPAKNEGIKFDESENLFIEGDNLEILKLLQKAYFEKVKMIYIDPPYNTGGDFVYRDDFSAPLKNYLKQTGQIDGNGNKLQANRETSGRYHSDWLSMMYPRLKLAWNLLRDDGIVFVSIDDNEMHHLRILLDEIFGEENFIACITVEGNPRGRDYGGVARMHDFLLIYSKSALAEINSLNEPNKEFPYSDSKGGFEIRELRNRNIAFHIGNRPNLYYPFYVNLKEQDENGFFRISLENKKGWVEIVPKESQGYKTVWRWGKEKSKGNLNTEIVAKQMESGGFQIVEKYRKTTRMARSIWDDKDVNTEKGTLLVKEILEAKVFSFPKPVEMIMRVVEMGSTGDDIILDFFAGSGTTAHATMALNAKDGGNRKWICVQLPEKTSAESEAYKAGFVNIADIAKERIRRAIKMIEDEVGEKRGYHNGLQEVYGYKDREIKELQADESGHHYDFDDGFKVFKLAKSNYPENNFEFDPEKSEQENQKTFKEYLAKVKQANLFEDGIKEFDVVYENIVKEGFSLNSKISEEKIGKNKMYTVTDLPAKALAQVGGERRLLICLDKKIDSKTIEELADKGYKGKTFICLDNALNDTAKANLGLNVELKTI